MKFSKGQLVLCYRTNDVKNHKLVGATGEVREILSGLLSLMFRADYAVFFPAFPEGICSDCSQFHSPLIFFMAENELKAIEDPDAGEVRIVDKKLPEEITS